jgi:hypothetical protein
MQTGVFSSTAQCRYAANSEHPKASSAYQFESIRDQHTLHTKVNTSLELTEQFSNRFLLSKIKKNSLQRHQCLALLGSQFRFNSCCQILLLFTIIFLDQPEFRGIDPDNEPHMTQSSQIKPYSSGLRFSGTM